MYLGKTAGCGWPLLALAIAIALAATAAHAQYGGYGPRYGEWQPMLEVVIQPTPGLTIGFSTGPYYGPPLRPYFIPPPPVFYGGPQYGYSEPPQYGGWGNNYGNYGNDPAYQQGYDTQWRRRAREQQDAMDAAHRAAGRRDADRAWGYGPTYNGRRR